jgi:hypothetical protein
MGDGERTLNHRIGRKMAVVVWAAVCLSQILGAQDNQDSQMTAADPSPDVLKVFQVIETIETAPAQPAGQPLRKAAISERELNAYIDFRRRNERWDMMKELKLKLLDDQKLEGMFILDLTGTEFASWLPDTATFLFAARLETSAGKARIQLEKLFIGQQQIQPAIIDLILLFASKKNNQYVSSLKEWIGLPIGIRELKTGKESLTALY